MNWEQLLSTKRSRGSSGKNRYGKNTDLRSEFEKDYHRIIGSASFRRLQDKTQVFPLDKSDFIRTRLTHSLEVSSFAKSLGQNIGENILVYKKDPSFTPRMKEDICSILQCAGLIHDIGNPPFGHFGESAIREWFERNLPRMEFHGVTIDKALTPQMREDFYHFEGNAQALRLVTKLHFLVDENGMRYRTEEEIAKASSDPDYAKNTGIGNYTGFPIYGDGAVDENGNPYTPVTRESVIAEYNEEQKAACEAWNVEMLTDIFPQPDEFETPPYSPLWAYATPQEITNNVDILNEIAWPGLIKCVTESVDNFDANWDKLIADYEANGLEETEQMMTDFLAEKIS